MSLNKIIKKGTSDVHNQIQERIRSPLSGAFIISWVIINYQFILVVFSSMEIEKKLSFIHTNLYPYDSWWTWCSLIGQPFMFAALYILIYPIIGKFFYAYSRKQQHILNNAKQKIDGERLLSQKESEEIIKEYIKLKNETVSAKKRLQAAEKEVANLYNENHTLRENK